MLPSKRMPAITFNEKCSVLPFPMQSVIENTISKILHRELRLAKQKEKGHNPGHSSLET